MRKQGYCLQQDEFFEELTVLETLAFQAAVRVPHDIDLETRIGHIDSILHRMDLSSVADCKVGGTTFKGISGGQRRRLSIGCELLSEPSVLFLDEPTSGLDGTSSLRLCHLLHSLAHESGRTVVTTIHQPRPEICALIDSLMVLVPTPVGGQVSAVPSSTHLFAFAHTAA